MESERRHPLAKCEVCPLNVPGTVFVGSYGPDQADVVVVGEAPGHQETKSGTPFTGPSGKLLDLVLDNYSIKRADVFVTNACLCRPSGNATPPKEAVRACWPRLKEEVNARNPKWIISLGNTASQAILDTRQGITTLRSGPPRSAAAFPTALVVPTVHPAACLRSSDMFPSMVTDIGKVVSNVYSQWESPTYKVFDEPLQARKALRELLQRNGPIVIDIEVGIDKDNDYDHPDRYQLLCVGLGYAAGRAMVLGERACHDPRVLADLRVVLETRQLIAHNGKFDFAGLWKYGHGQTWFDTMLASYCVDERPGTHGLKYLASEILGAPEYDAELKRIVGKGSYATAPRELLYKYNAYDVTCTWGLYEYYVDRLEREGLRGLHDFLVAAGNELMHLEMEGIQVDVDYLNELTNTYLDDLDILEEKLCGIVGHGFNPRSPKQVKEYLENVGLRVASTNEETLRGLLESGNAVDFCELMLEQRREQKLYGTYVKGIRKRLYQERVYPTFLLHGTVSGRLACRNPNMQNVPRESKIRKLFVPSDGRVFVQGDYAQAELRVMATLSGDQWLKEVFDAGRDLHSEVATRFFGPDFTKEQRVRAKAVVFGLAYGREAYSLAEEFKIPVREAQRYLDTFFDAIPELSNWRSGVQDQVLHSQEDLVSPFGRHRRFWLITEENKKDVAKEALSFLPQSTASDICLHALMRLRCGLGSRGNVRLPVHDSILVECLASDSADVQRYVKEVMEETAKEKFGDYVDFPVDVNVGDSWGTLE